MNRTAFLPLILLGLIAAGCGRDGVVDPSRSPLTRPTLTTDIDPDVLDYEEITGQIMPNQSGVMGDYLTTWGKNCFFGFIVPQGALPPGSNAVDFTIRVPTKASYLAHSELDNIIFVRLQPENMEFQIPITVIATWMPWEGTPPSPLIFSSGNDSGTANVTYSANTNRYTVTFDTDHFSDWEVGPGPMAPGMFR